MPHLPLYIYFIAFSLFVSFSLYKQNGSHFYLKFFNPFLLISIIVEIYALYLWNNGKDNYKVYSYFTVFEFCFYLFILSNIIATIKIKRIIIFSLVVYLLISLININLIQKDTFHSVTYSLGCLLIVIFCIYYFFELFRSPIAVKLTGEPPFWICSGLLFYYCCSLPLYGGINFLYQLPKFLLYNMQNIVNVMNILLYSLFTIAFLCRLRIPKYTLQ